MSCSPCHLSPTTTTQIWAWVFPFPGVHTSIPHCYVTYSGMKISQNRKEKLHMRHKLVIELSCFLFFFFLNIIQSNCLCVGAQLMSSACWTAQDLRKTGSSWEAIPWGYHCTYYCFYKGWKSQILNGIGIWVWAFTAFSPWTGGIWKWHHHVHIRCH